MNASTVYIRFYFYAAAIPAATEQIMEVMDTASAVKAQLRIQSDGTLRIVDSLPSVVATSSFALSAATWYRIEMEIPTNTNASRLRVDGTVVASGVGNFGTVNTGSIKLGKATNVNSTAVEYYYDDICAKDDDWPNDGKVVILKPNDAGTYTAWLNELGSNLNNHLSVDEVPHDSNTTYVASTVNGNAETFNMESLSLETSVSTALITAVKPLLVVSRPGLAATFKIRIRSGGFNSDTAALGANTAYTGHGDIHEIDPNTLDPWTFSAVNSMEVGIVHSIAAAREIRMTACYAFVDYRPNLRPTADLQQVNFVTPDAKANYIAEGKIDTVSIINNQRNLTSVVGLFSATFDTVSSINGDGGFALSGNSEFFTISTLDSTNSVLRNASTEIQTITNLNSVPKLTLTTDVSLAGIVSLYSDGFILGQVIAEILISSVSQLDSTSQLTLRVTSDLQTVTDILQSAQASKVAFGSIDTISSVGDTAQVSVKGTASLAEIVELASTAGRLVSGNTEFNTISNINSAPRVLMLSIGGFGTISDTLLTAVVTSLQNSSEFQTVTQLDLSAVVQQMAFTEFHTVNTLESDGGKTIDAVGDFHSVSEMESSAQISIGAISVGEFFTISDVQADGKLTFVESARFQTVVSLLSDGDSVPTVWEQRNLAMVVQIRPDFREMIGEVVNLTLYVTPAYRD